MTSFPAEQRQDLPVTGELVRELLTGTIELPGADFRVLMYYATGTELGDTVRETAREIAQALNLHEGSVGKSVKRLGEGGWLERSYKVGRVAFYRVGPKVMELAAGAEEDEQPLAEVHQLPARAELFEE